MSRNPAVLFVCLGNICRSPLAEAAFRKAAKAAGLACDVDSAGTGDWHIGHPPDRRAQVVARHNGIDISRLTARQVTDADFHQFDHIVALDHTNLEHLRVMAPPDATARLSLLLDHAPGRRGEAVEDPYFGNAQGFETAWSEVVAGAYGLVAKLRGA